MLSNYFEKQGLFFASHPWEVIMAVFTLIACMLALDNDVPTIVATVISSKSEEAHHSVDLIFTTIVRCCAVLYSYYQFCKLRKFGCDYVLAIAGLFTVFSTFVFSTAVINFLQRDVSDLKDALFLFVLVIDLSKASTLAQFALNSAEPAEVNKNIGKAMGILGPVVTLDTLVGTLVISVGTLSGVRRLEMLCLFACFSFIVNYILYMTFYPACVSLVLELSRSNFEEGKEKVGKCCDVTLESLYDENRKPNPVVQRVKVIMSAGMMIVHARSRWNFTGMDHAEPFDPKFGVSNRNVLNSPFNEMDETSYLIKFVSASADHIVVLILILALTVKFAFFDEEEEVVENHLACLQRVQKSDNCCQTEATLSPDIVADKLVQTDDVQMECAPCFKITRSDFGNVATRSEEECAFIYRQEGNARNLSDAEVRNLVKKNVIRSHQLESAVDDPERGIAIRRCIICEDADVLEAIEDIPYEHYDFSKVIGACCENVVGYVPIPVGLCGPLMLDGCSYYVPLATTEGCLVASTNRGCRALFKSGGVRSRVFADAMSRGPVARFPSAALASEAMLWINDPRNFETIKSSFDSTSRFARLQRILVRIAGRQLYIRFSATTGDAMGMNMISKGTEAALNAIKTHFEEMEVLSLSGNFCTDKKPSALNWIEGRGKGVVCEAVVPESVINSVLKTSSRALVDVNVSKNLVGSAMAGCIGGNNAHAANIVTGIYIATGQDPAQNVASSNCITLMETCGAEGKDLYISCTMPSIEIGTVGGGTALPAQSACLDLLRVKGANESNPGDNAKTLARIVCATVLAGELSLMSALTAGHLVRSHLRYNRTSLSEQNNASKMLRCISEATVLGRCSTN